ncbi:MAG TPA: triple tyrosine motif-containing protein, partial [Bacteroidia bacterium]|nr:triple tyrosine motif-containing protein [Bacteroidia bacterium]
PNNVIYGLLSDNAGNLWMSTNKGLCCLPASRTPNNANNKFSNTHIESNPFICFNSDDGLPGDEFNRHEYFKLPNGDLYFEGVMGGVHFSPLKILEQEPNAPIVLTKLLVYNKPVTFQTDSSIIQMPVSYAKSITLPPDKNMFTITFAALNYSSASKRLYKYMLDGYDKQWIESGLKNEATYTNLAPGTYTFKVIHAQNNNSPQNETAIQIIIKPAWYQTWLFKITLTTLLAVSVIGLYRYRLNQQINLMHIRNRIASDLHDEIGSTLSSISISSTIIQNKMNGHDSDVKKLLQQISINTDNMMEAMSDIVWSINTKNDRFDNIINRMRAFAIEMMEPKNCMVHFNTKNINVNTKLDLLQRKNLYLIFKEAINNAAKYAQCKNVWIAITMQGNKLIMCIKD